MKFLVKVLVILILVSFGAEMLSSIVSTESKCDHSSEISFQAPASSHSHAMCECAKHSHFGEGLLPCTSPTSPLAFVVADRPGDQWPPTTPAVRFPIRPPIA